MLFVSILKATRHTWLLSGILNVLLNIHKKFNSAKTFSDNSNNSDSCFGCKILFWSCFRKEQLIRHFSKHETNILMET